MDASQKLIKNIAILAATGLLLSAVGLAQPTLVATPTTVVIPASASNTASVTSSDGTTVITYTVGTPRYNGDPAWLTVTPTGTTTTAATTSLQFTARNVAWGSASPHTATVTLTPTNGTAAVVITVSYDTGGGGGGGGATLFADRSSVALTSTSRATTVNITT